MVCPAGRVAPTVQPLIAALPRLRTVTVACAPPGQELSIAQVTAQELVPVVVGVVVVGVVVVGVDGVVGEVVVVVVVVLMGGVPLTPMKARAYAAIPVIGRM